MHGRHKADKKRRTKLIRRHEGVRNFGIQGVGFDERVIMKCILILKCRMD
jgi:hypothetical protein